MGISAEIKTSLEISAENEFKSLFTRETFCLVSMGS